MGYPFENHLQLIDHINSVKNCDRQSYTTMYNTVRDALLGRMCLVNATFEKLYKGSYPNNVRIRKPNEFDVLFVLEVPHSDELLIESDEYRPGFVNLNFDDVMEELANDEHLSYVYDELEENLLDRNIYLKRTNLQWWIHDIIEEVFERFGDRIGGMEVEYQKSSVAHTMYVNDGRLLFPKRISIDFVPAIQFGRASWLQKRNFYPFVGCSGTFYAVPKSFNATPKGRRGHSLTFLLVNPIAEYKLLLGKQNLKVALRLLKALRDCYRPSLRRLKSYFLVTMFLWQIRKRSESFWDEPVDIIFLEASIYK
uniref:Mab-21 domain-containing protein n=1 Tax=Glossina austeni TaxID=7395 RepID=A0A1A9VCV9_GLOAU